MSTTKKPASLSPAGSYFIDKPRYFDGAEYFHM
jgi:hypothetical protein